MTTTLRIANLAERVSGRALTAWALVGLVLVPAVISAAFAWTQADAIEHLERIEAAVVNNDEPVTVKGQYVPLGRVLVAELTDPERENNLTWTNTDAETAAEGLRTGRFATVVTIPESFSAAATSLAAQDPDLARHATLDITTSPSGGVVDPTVGQAVAAAVTSALNTQLVETFVDNIYVGFSDMKDQLGNAVDGAGELAGGADELHAGVGKAAAGAAELSAGLGRLAAGSAELATGADRLAAGSRQLADGLGVLRDRTSDLPAQTAQLAAGADQVRDGVQLVVGQVQDVIDQLEQAGLDAETAGAQLGRADALLDATSAEVARLEAACAETPSPACDLLPSVRQLLDQQSSILGLLQQSVTLLEQAPEVSAQLDAFADGADQLADGAAQLAAGMAGLVGGIDRAATGAEKLADGNARLADGARKLAGGAAEARDGSAELATGMGRLEEGAGQLAAGADELHQGLADGVAQIPSYDADERRKLAEVAAEPVRTGELGFPDPRLAAAYFTAVALAIAALVTYTLLRAVPRRTLTSSSGSLVLALQAFRPSIVIATLQAIAVAFGMQLALDLGWTTLLAYAGVVLLASLAMCAVTQALVALLGGTGRFVAVFALAITAATAIVSTTPPGLRAVVELTPVAPTIQGLRDVVLGTGVGAECAALVAWLLAGLAVTVLAIARKRTVTAAQVAGLLAPATPA